MTLRSGELPSRFPSSDAPWTVARSVTTGGAFGTGAGMFGVGRVGWAPNGAAMAVARISRRIDMRGRGKGSPAGDDRPPQQHGVGRIGLGAEAVPRHRPVALQPQV